VSEGDEWASRDSPPGLAEMPRPLLSSRAEALLGPRHRQVLDRLETIFLSQGFASMTVARLASGVGCSRRTLYELAPSKEALVLVVVDRFLHRVGRNALAAIDRTLPFADQIRAYYRGGLELQRQTTQFVIDLADDPAARRLLDQHFRFAMAVMEELIADGIAAGEFRSTSPGVVAGVLAGSGLFLSQSDVLDGLPLDRDQVPDEVVDLVLRSLAGS
jgi:AcrR family transcriptional regulator